MQVGRLFVALRNKSNELRALTGDGRLDLMDILLEFTRIVKGNRNDKKEFHLLQQKNRTRASPENIQRIAKKQNVDNKENNFSELSGQKRFSSHSESPTDRFRYYDIEMRRMTYSQYKEMLESYARKKKWGSFQQEYIKNNEDKRCI